MDEILVRLFRSLHRFCSRVCVGLLCWWSRRPEWTNQTARLHAWFGLTCKESALLSRAYSFQRKVFGPSCIRSQWHRQRSSLTPSHGFACTWPPVPCIQEYLRFRLHCQLCELWLLRSLSSADTLNCRKPGSRAWYLDGWYLMNEPHQGRGLSMR